MKQRADLFLAGQGYFESREQAQRSIMAGEVFLDGKLVEKPGQMINVGRIADPLSVKVQINRNEQQYVSRGGKKLEKAINQFHLDVSGKVCLDAGASTGGFTDCLLQNGAAHVYAVDVGYGQLAWKIRQDSRVTVFERENIRHFEAARLPDRPTLITADLSFISLELVLTKFREIIGANPDGDLITLIKPQFEAGKDKVGKKGVVRDRETHLEILERLMRNAPALGWVLVGLAHSPLLGPEGNIEYLGRWRIMPEAEGTALNAATVVDAAWNELKI